MNRNKQINEKQNRELRVETEKCNLCSGTGIKVIQTQFGEHEQEPCLCLAEKEFFRLHGIVEEENITTVDYREEGMGQPDKQYIRFINGIVSLNDVQAFTWSSLKETESLANLFVNQKVGEGEQKYFKLVIFLRGGQNFVTACTRKNMEKMRYRFKQLHTEVEDYA